MHHRIESPLDWLLERSGQKGTEPQRLAAGEHLQAIAPQGFSPHDYVVFLLTMGAEIEHSLMVQYLYAAYSYGGPQVPEEHRPMVKRWQDTLLSIAREEMGHLMTVQNLLRLLGGPINLSREDFPWDSKLTPFPFSLEPVTQTLLAQYVVAESPTDWGDAATPEEKAQILAQAAHGAGKPVNRVGALYSYILTLLDNPVALPDADFHAETLPFQATWAEWGRNYGPPPKGDVIGTNMLIDTAYSRQTVVDAITRLATQGEALDLQEDAQYNETSHFQRFLTLWREFPIVGAAAVRPVASNPQLPLPSLPSGGKRLRPGKEWTDALAQGVKWRLGSIYRSRLLEGEDAANLLKEALTEGIETVLRDKVEELGAPLSVLGASPPTPILNRVSQSWAQLFDLRYRMLLTWLTHSFCLSRLDGTETATTPRGMVVQRTFGEMYNLKALAFILVQQPIAEEDKPLRAGPCFRMPYTLELPLDEPARWGLHRDLLEASEILVAELTAMGVSGREADYLASLRALDADTIAAIDTILGRGTTPSEIRSRS